MQMVFFPILNFSRTLPDEEQEMLQELNKHLETKYPYLPELPRTEFHTEQDAIHWTPHTAARLLQHWTKWGN